MTDSHKPHESHHRKHAHGHPEQEGERKQWAGEEEKKRRTEPVSETRGRG
jgi:hypothetical protein